MDVQKEANLMKAVKLFIQEHGVQEFYKPISPKNKKSFFPKTISLKIFRKADIEEYVEDVHNSVLKHQKLYNFFKRKVPHVEVLIYRYDLLGFLNNISLSVHPSLKKEWKIEHELFGAFYNVDSKHSYCSLFPDLEPKSEGNVLFFKPKKESIILANPPYTTEWIRWTIRKILDEWKDWCTFYVVIPVWDHETRQKLNLSKYPDFPEISELISFAKEHRVERIPFYDGINDKKVYLKDPVHIIRI